MKTLLLGASALALLVSSPASARLQLSISDGTTTFSCFDGQLGCDQSGGANNLLTINTTVGNAFVELTLTQSAFGNPNSLQLSSSNIVNEGSTPLTVTLLASDNGFTAPVTFIRDSASLTFNDAVGSGLSTLQFWADPLNTQGANPNNTPGALLETVSGTPTTNPDSFAGSNDAAFDASSAFSMTEGARLNLIGGGSITGFNQSMTSGVPEASTWAMMLVGFVGLGWGAWSRKRVRTLAI